MILQVLITMIAGWIQRHQQKTIAYLMEENRILKAKLGARRLCLTDMERRRLAALAYPLGRKGLKSVATIATPGTLMRGYNRLIAQKFDSTKKRKALGRLRVPDEVEQLVIRMANENPTWGYRRIQGDIRFQYRGERQMSKIIEAVYENGVFRPLEPVVLPEGEHVEIRLPEFTRAQQERLAALEAFEEQGNDLSEEQWKSFEEAVQRRPWFGGRQLDL